MQEDEPCMALLYVSVYSYIRGRQKAWHKKFSVMQYVICNIFLSEIFVCQAEYKPYAWSNDWHVYPKNLKAGSKKSFYILNG